MYRVIDYLYRKITTSQWAPILFISGIILILWRAYSAWKMQRIFNHRYDLLMKQSEASAKVKELQTKQIGTQKEIDLLNRQIDADVEKLKENKHETMAKWLDRWNSPTDYK